MNGPDDYPSPFEDGPSPDDETEAEARRKAREEDRLEAADRANDPDGD